MTPVMVAAAALLVTSGYFCLLSGRSNRIPDIKEIMLWLELHMHQGWLRTLVMEAAQHPPEYLSEATTDAYITRKTYKYTTTLQSLSDTLAIAGRCLYNSVCACEARQLDARVCGVANVSIVLAVCFAALLIGSMMGGPRRQAAGGMEATRGHLSCHGLKLKTTKC